MRLFLAIELPESTRAHLERIQRQLAGPFRGLSMTRPQNLHLTLKFLGEVEDQAVLPLTHALAGIRSRAVELRPTSAELFPPRGPVRIVAVGLQDPTSTLGALHGAIESALQPLGYPSEGRPFRPHVTLARSRSGLPPAQRGPIAKLIEEHLPLDSFLVEEFVLVQSTLLPEGPQYTIAAHFPLEA
jgi:2'-5' RNA ligase